MAGQRAALPGDLRETASDGCVESPKSSAPPEADHRAADGPGGPPTIDPVAVIRSKAYIAALVFAAIAGIPISAIAYGFLALVAAIQQLLFFDLPEQLLGGSTPAWWPLPWLTLCGLLTALAIRFLPGKGGHSPALGSQRAQVRPPGVSFRVSPSPRWPRSASARSLDLKLR
jgi:hypothetical protein